MSKVRIFALGGLDEDGKNMLVVEVDEKIFVIEAGLKYPDSETLGVEFIIPDFSYLIQNKDRVKAIFITHAHDDVVAALPYLLKQINVPVYTGAMTALIIRETLKKEGIRNVKVHRIKRSDTMRIDGVRIQTFPMTHAFPDTFGVAISTDQGYVVYTGEFIIDYDMMQEEYCCDLNLLSEFGKKGVGGAAVRIPGRGAQRAYLAQSSDHESHRADHREPSGRAYPDLYLFSVAVPHPRDPGCGDQIPQEDLHPR